MLHKFKFIIQSKKGESLVESIISIMIFSLLLVTIALTIQTALRISTITSEDANRLQRTANELIAGQFDDAVIGTISFTSTGGVTINSSHQVVFANVDGLRAFHPQD